MASKVSVTSKAHLGPLSLTTYTFIAPVTSQYAFFFGGFYADKTVVDKPYRGLSENVTLEVTVFPY